jgi:peroxiredoxin Q/BCP
MAKTAKPAATRKPAAKPAAKTAAKKPAAKAATKAPAAKKPPAKAAAAKAAVKPAAKPSTKAAVKPAAKAAARPAPAAAPPASGPGIGDAAPAFSLPATGGRTASTEALKGKPFVVYFYPKADTPGCTTEACDFNEALTQFKGLGIDVIGISKDPMPALEKFAAKYNLSFPLASDPDNATAQAYGAWGEKVFMGRRSIGLLRSTFLVDKEGKIAKAWKKVKVEGHAAEVLEAAKALG